MKLTWIAQWRRSCVAPENDGVQEELIGREPERAQLDAWVTEAMAGHGSLVLLSGEAGVGKTSLAKNTLTRSGLQTLEGFAVQGGTSPFGPIVEGLRSYRRAAGDVPLVEGPLAGHLAMLLPELGPPAAVGDRATLFEAIRQALAGIAARRPTVLFLDDLQWADDATPELLGALARSLDSRTIAGAGRVPQRRVAARTLRSERLRSELRRASRLRQIAVEPFDAEASAALLEQTLGTVAPSLRRAVFDRTDGVAFFVRELGSALPPAAAWYRGRPAWSCVEGEDVPLPDSVRDAVLLRAAGLSDDAHNAVTTAAVAGQTFDPELVIAVAGLSEWPEEVVRRGIVTEAEPGRMAFRHALVRDAFYGDIPWTRRVAVHQAVAQRLEAGHAASVLVAEHWVLGRRPEQARAALLRAAEASSAVHAYRDAERVTRRALELWPDGDDEAVRLDVLERLAGYAELAGDLADAVPTWREVADRTPARQRPATPGNGAAPAGSCAGAAGSLARGAQQPGAGRVGVHRRRLTGRRRSGAYRLRGPSSIRRELPRSHQLAADRRGAGA